MDRLLRQFAHAIAPGATRAVVDRKDHTMTVYTASESVVLGTVVVARCGETFVTGRIARPAPGWVEIDGTVYPASNVELRGSVLFIAHWEDGPKGDQGEENRPGKTET